ncbi:MAG: amidase [Pseudomonadota bacterium]
MTDALWRLPAVVLREMVATRVISAREAAEAAIARMDTVNPALNAVVTRFDEQALAEADRVDAALAAGEAPGPLMGVPVTVKVIADQAGHATTNGLRLQRDHVVAEDAPVVANLRRAGAVIVGRTNTPAFSIRWFTRNALHGATRNPHSAAITPGGSSGGASSAVAAGIGAVAHGTDIAGSVRYPAYVCNLHGLRPSLGRVPQVNPGQADRSIGPQIMAVSGPLARRIDDIEAALVAMSAGDARDGWWVPAPLTGPALARRVALVTHPDGLDTAPEVVAALKAAAAVLADHGWQVEEVEAPTLQEGVALNIALWMGEFRGQGVARVAEEADPDASRIAPWLLERAAECPDVETALQARMGFVRRWQMFLETWPLVLCPVSADAPFADHQDVESAEAFDRVFRAQLTQIALPVTGLPALNVATGRPGAPMGVQLVAPRYREDLLIEAGRAIEAAHPPVEPVDPFVVGG